MSEEHAPRCYGAIPFRALRDRRLAGIPLALLGIIAAHDRFGHNGQGCTATQGRLAELVGCHRQQINLAIQLLDQHGYISCGVFGKGDRRITYSVIYNEADVEAFGSSKVRGAVSLGRAVKRSQRPAKGCLPEQTTPEPACLPEQTSQDIDLSQQSSETAAKTRLLAQSEYIQLKLSEERKSGFLMQHGAGPEPPDIGSEDDATAIPNRSLQNANERLWAKYGRPNLAANLGLGRRA